MDHVKTIKAGAPGYLTPRERGTVDVWYDSKRYVFTRYRGETRGMVRREVTARFGGRVTGACPSYEVQ